MDKYRLPPDNMIEAHQDVKKRVSKLERNPRASNTSVDSGEYTIRAGNFSYVDPTSGQQLVKFGDIGGSLLRGWVFRRLNGQLAFYIGGSKGGGQFWALVDASSNIVMSDDIVSGQGLATPYIPITTVPAIRMSSAEVTTTSTTFVPMYRMNALKQHPKIYAEFLATTPAGVTAEVILGNTVTGVTIAGPLTIPANTSLQFFNLVGIVTGGHMSYLGIDVQMRVASGAGTVGMSFLDAYGRQS